MYALQSQLPIYIFTLAFGIIATSVMFAGEFQMQTIYSVFASTGLRTSICGAKLIALLIVLIGIIIPTGLVDLLIGAIITVDRIAGVELGKSAQVLIGSIPGYFALVPMGMLSIIAAASLTNRHIDCEARASPPLSYQRHRLTRR